MVRHHLLSPVRRRVERTPIERFQRQTEAHEIGEVRERLRTEVSCFVKQAHGVDDDRGVPEPVKEVVRIRIVGPEHRRSDDGARDRPHGLPEARALFHDVAGGNARQHGGRGVPVLAIEPLL